MKIIVNVVYDRNDRVSCSNRKKFEKSVSDIMDAVVRTSLFGSIKYLDVSCFSMNLKEDQYYETLQR